MTIKNFVTGILASIAIISGLAVSGIPESVDWWINTKPFFCICLISIAVAFLINKFNYVRRIMYPILVCISAWSYKYRIVVTGFTKDTYRVYKLNNYSYKQLFGYTQDLFDAMYM